MAPSLKPDQRLNLSHLPQISATQPRSGSSTANTSPIESHPGNPARSPFGNPVSKATPGGVASAGNSRTGTGSPSHELGSARPFSKRAREIQASEGLIPQFWGPPASGGSTPLRETIPESPSQDGFPDFLPPSDSSNAGSVRRPRAGTVPSRFSPAAPPGLGGVSSSQPKTSRPTPSSSPFRSASYMGDTSNSTSTLLSRLRAGSMPQQNTQDGQSPFGSNLFASNWNTSRNRSSTLASVRSNESPNSPAQSAFSRDGLADADVKTLDYLGLAETAPRQTQATLMHPDLQGVNLQPYLNNLAGMNKNLSRLRSFSVNAKEKYADDEEDYLQSENYSGQNSGIMTPMDAALAQTRAQIHHHNLAVQAFASQASANRPRARTAGVLDSPLRPAPAPMRLPTARPRQLSNAIPNFDWSEEYEGLPEAVQAMNLNAIARRSTLESLDDSSQDRPTRALWLGNIPTSTTNSSLEALFGIHGKIESCRVLMHKNCGFVNFENVESARLAKATLNGKEIFPGAGPVKIGYAKEPNSSSMGGTPANHQSGSPEPSIRLQTDQSISQAGDDAHHDRNFNGTSHQNSYATFEIPSLSEAKGEILEMAQEFAATAEERYAIDDSIASAIAFTDFQDVIAPVAEQSQSRIYDAPRLRDIRKKIDNNAMSHFDIEETARNMLPEVAELASDYLGNTVVQKLFEYCSEEIKEEMLGQIAPHLAQIGVHKNGTWAAQKIIDVCKSDGQKRMIVDHLRPSTVGLFLDQYGNYVLQGCLRFGPRHNCFIFETMLSRMWDIAQGRFGARAMRACLESHHASRAQQRMLAAAIVLHSVKLATNANGALLLTWFLDTCNLPHRRTALAPRLVPHLVQLCTHKVAYLTVLKVINQRNEVEARDIVLKALFSDDSKVLEDILSDQQCGATLIFKVITTPGFDEAQRNDVLQKVRNVLIRLKVSPSQGYKRLMDEVGMQPKSGARERDVTPNGHAHHYERPRSTPHGGSRDRKHYHNDGGRHHPDSQVYPSAQQPFPMQTGFSGASLDPNTLLAYEQMTPSYANNSVNGVGFQQPLLGRESSPGGFYPNVGMGSFPQASAGMNQLPQRQMAMNANPVMPQNGFPQPGLNSMMSYTGMPSYQQFPMQYTQQQQQQQQPQQAPPMMQADSRGRRR